MPTVCTRSSASPGPGGAGSGVSMKRSLPGSVNSMALIVLVESVWWRRPLPPPPPPSAGEREIRPPSQRRPATANGTKTCGDFDERRLLFPLPRRGGEGQGEGPFRFRLHGLIIFRQPLDMPHIFHRRENRPHFAQQGFVHRLGCPLRPPADVLRVGAAGDGC